MTVQEAKERLKKYSKSEMHTAHIYEKTGEIKLPESVDDMDNLSKSQERDLKRKAEQNSKDIIRLQHIVKSKNSYKVTVSDQELTAKEINMLIRSLIMYESSIKKSISNINDVNPLNMKYLKSQRDQLLKNQENELIMSRQLRKKLRGKTHVNATGKKLE